MKFLVVIVIAIVVEGITEYIKLMVPELADKTKALLLITVALGVVTSLAYNADVFEALGIAKNFPYVGCILTGILCARGSNYIYDLVGKFTDAGEFVRSLDIPDEEAPYETGEDEHGVG